ncbi:DNA-directed RNA polymerase subunit H [Candidatus Micrarchaeota archaeon]|nr:DNA-directed RNA polymerase subunit H [Candidatus Micrarchaeota archaeon]
MPESKLASTVHVLVPRMEVASQKEVGEMLEKHGISAEDLPRIRITDPALIPLGPKIGDVIKIFRQSPATCCEVLYYRLVVE